MYKHLITLIILATVTNTLTSQHEYDYLKEKECTIIKNVKYGEHERNVFDIVLPKSDNPTALVIYFHGGGFVAGDKTTAFQYRADDIEYFMDNNIAFATANYRFLNGHDSIGVKACINDAVNALKYIRYNAEKYNINKDRIGCYGHSAGAGISLYIAFNDDLAIINDNTHLGESTLIKCAGALDTQATYDVFRWKEFIPCFRFLVFIARRYFFNSAANFYGYPSYKAFKPHKEEILKSVDLLNMITPNSPPIYVMNMVKGRFPRNANIVQHHVAHAKILSKELTKHNVENHIFTYSIKYKNGRKPEYSISKFMVEKLTE